MIVLRYVIDSNMLTVISLHIFTVCNCLCKRLWIISVSRFLLRVMLHMNHGCTDEAIRVWNYHLWDYQFYVVMVCTWCIWMHWQILVIYTVCITVCTIQENKYFKSFKRSVVFVYIWFLTMSEGREIALRRVMDYFNERFPGVKWRTLKLLDVELLQIILNVHGT